MMRYFALGTLALMALGTAGCGRSPQVSFYTLASGTGVESATAKAGPVTARGPSVVVGPVTLPEVVDRPQLVVRVAANRVDILETRRWAEPLKSEIPRLIARQLGRFLGSDSVFYYRQRAGLTPDYRVLLDIVRFESLPGEAVVVEAAWSIGRAFGRPIRSGHSLVREKVSDGGYDALVSAYNRALAEVSGDLAKALQAEIAAAK